MQSEVASFKKETSSKPYTLLVLVMSLIMIALLALDWYLVMDTMLVWLIAMSALVAATIVTTLILFKKKLV